MLCTNPFACASPIATWNTFIGADASVQIAVATNLTEFVFGYGYVGEIDGVDINVSGGLGIKLSYYFSGCGFDTQIRQASSRGLLRNIRPPGRDQYMTISGRLSMKKFTDFYYDPDMNLRILFDTSSPPAVAGGAPDSLLNVVSSNTIGIATGVSLAVIVAVAVIVSVVVYRWRRSRTVKEREFMQSRIQKAQTTSDAPRTSAVAPQQNRDSVGWQKAQPRESTM
jgi:hypothetical protein